MHVPLTLVQRLLALRDRLAQVLLRLLESYLARAERKRERDRRRAARGGWINLALMVLFAGAMAEGAWELIPEGHQLLSAFAMLFAMAFAMYLLSLVARKQIDAEDAARKGRSGP